MKNRIPKIQEIISVYAIISFILYGWTFVLFFWKLPSWLHFMTLSEIFAAFSYGILTNLFESLIVISGLLILYLFLPPRYFQNTFSAYGSTAAIVALGSVMVYQFQYRAVRLDFTSGLRSWVLATVISVLLSVFLTAKIKVLRMVILNISDRMIIFLYIIIPLSAICVVNVIIRNLI